MRKFALFIALVFCTPFALAKTLSTVVLLSPSTGYYTASNTGTVQLTPLCTYSDLSADNCTASGITLTWTSDNPSAMSVNSSGLATALGVYSTLSGGVVAPSHIFAYSGSIVGSVGIYVDGIPITTLASRPQGADNIIIAGSTALLSAVGNYGTTNAYVGNFCGWSSSNTGVATVNQLGEVTGVSAGSVTVTCTLGTLTVGRSLTIAAAPTGGHTYYVRPNGGTRYDAAVTTGQCVGTTDADYPGTGTQQACAFNNPEYLFTDETSSTVYTGALVGGDVAIIHPATPGSPYPVDYHADKTTKWITAATSEGAMVPPSGAPGLPTKILGSNYASCASSPHGIGARSAMFSYTGVSDVFQLTGLQNVDIECLDISTGVDCNANFDQVQFSCPNSATHLNALRLDDLSGSIAMHHNRVHGYLSGVTGTPGPGFTMDGDSVEYNVLDGLNFDDPYQEYGNRSDGFSAQGMYSTYNGCSDEQQKALTSVSRDGAGNLNVAFAAGQIVNYLSTTNLVLTGNTPSDLNGTFPVNSITFNQQQVTITGGTVGQLGSNEGTAEAIFTTSTAPTFSQGAFAQIVGATPSYLNGTYEVYAVSGSGFTVVASIVVNQGWTVTSGTISAGGTASTASSLVASAAGSSESASTVGTAGHVYSAHRCTDQDVGGNGDGVGTGADTISSWTCNQCTIWWNTQDGWDMLHSHMLYSTFTNSYSQGNMGAPMKVGYMDHGIVDNNLLIGNAQVLMSPDPNRAPDANQYLSYFYRASDTFPLGTLLWSNIVVTNNTFDTGFSTMIDAGHCQSIGGCASGVAGLSQFLIQNNNFLGFLDTNSDVYSGSYPGMYCDNVCAGFPASSATWTWNNNIWYNVKTFAPSGSDNKAVTNPLVTLMIPNISSWAGEANAQTFNMNLTASSPAIGAGVENSYVPILDYAGYTRPNPPSMGALEYQAAGSSASLILSGGITW